MAKGSSHPPSGPLCVCWGPWNFLPKHPEGLLVVPVWTSSQVCPTKGMHSSMCHLSPRDSSLKGEVGRTWMWPYQTLLVWLKLVLGREEEGWCLGTSSPTLPHCSRKPEDSEKSKFKPDFSVRYQDVFVNTSYWISCSLTYNFLYFDTGYIGFHSFSCPRPHEFEGECTGFH